MPGMVFPKVQPRITNSRAELSVFEALRRQLPEGWRAWHSLRLKVGPRYEGEADFVIAVPDRGFLVLEVKGGRLELLDGHWFQNGVRMSKAPRDQAQGFARNLAAELRRQGAGDVPFGIACAFPDVEFSEGPETGDLRGLVLGARQLQYLAECLPAVAARVVGIPRAPLGEKWLEVLHDLWGEYWVPHVRLKDQVQDSERRAVALNAEQLSLLDYAGDNPRALVEGGAGTGKTTVARELVVRWARLGKSALYLCFTDGLARAVDTQLRDVGLPTALARAVSVREYACELLSAAGQPLERGNQAFWDEVSRRAADVARPEHGSRPDLLVLDEAQDLEESDWRLVEALAGEGACWVFHDPRQSFWLDRRIPEAMQRGAVRLRLKSQQRSPESLARFALRYTGAPEPSEAAPDLGSVLRVCTAPEGELQETLRSVLDALVRDGARPSDIAIVSLGGQTRSLVWKLERLGAHSISRVDGPEAGSQVVADTFLRIKGLERPFILVTELSQGHGDKYDTRMHIALTRAALAATVVCTPAELAFDPRLQLAVGQGTAVNGSTEGKRHG